MNLRSIISLAMLVCALLTAGSCATFMSPEESLRKRVINYWDAMLQDKPDAAFGYMEPKLQNTEAHKRFVSGKRQFIFLGYEMQDLEIVGEHAKVLVKRTFKIAPGAIPVNIDEPLSQTLWDRWVRIKGTWYKTYEPPQNPFFEDAK
jgi:hypothetical protein